MNLPDRGLTLAEYGGLIGRTKQYMYLLEKGKIKFSYEMAARLVRALDTTQDNMFSSFIDSK